MKLAIHFESEEAAIEALEEIKEQLRSGDDGRFVAKLLPGSGLPDVNAVVEFVVEGSGEFSTPVASFKAAE
jgi:TRAP-type C4-dicarboxylate transport system substrate-binding protein